MKDRNTAIILLGCAILLAIGAYFLTTTDEEPIKSVHRSKVVKPTQEAPKAPDWVSGGQEVKPDYSSSDAEPKDVTPKPQEVIEEKEESQTIEVAEDKVVTFTFVEAFADFLLNRFQPRASNGKPASLASAMELNKYFGRELDGFAVDGDDIRAARKSILDYAFNPAMLETLYALYADPLMVHLIDTATNVEREYTVSDTKEVRTLTNEEVAVMLRLNGRRIERVADVFRALGTDLTITDMAAKYRRAAKAVERANEQLQNDIADDKNTRQSSERLKSAILQREREKVALTTHLKQICHSCSESELFYLSQWAYRRVVDGSKDVPETFISVANILDDLAIRFRDEASQLK